MYGAYYEPLQPSPNCNIFHDELADIWLEEDGILYAIDHNVQRTVEKQKATFALIRKITNNNRVCILEDVNNIGNQGQEVRKYIYRQIPELFKAMAISVKSSMGQLVANTFLTFGEQIIPMKIFDNHIEARNWLREYL